MPRILGGKLQISSLNSSSNTGIMYVMKLFLENITLLERQQFLPAAYICLCSNSLGGSGACHKHWLFTISKDPCSSADNESPG